MSVSVHTQTGGQRSYESTANDFDTTEAIKNQRVDEVHEGGTRIVQRQEQKWERAGDTELIVENYLKNVNQLRKNTREEMATDLVVEDYKNACGLSETLKEEAKKQSLAQTPLLQHRPHALNPIACFEINLVLDLKILKVCCRGVISDLMEAIQNFDPCIRYQYRNKNRIYIGVDLPSSSRSRDMSHLGDSGSHGLPARSNRGAKI